eukprot:Plantae.Rhodophyta-Purpureofilum_apyrenoidigerum.ctg25833.p2 GENE.Plantae.Rhodophyta-Purpureofilum_apyrenoidigerum.ctg25833~~Plantae.Rhodophyta-Purpureofilum_apyrenoidigerum.ctg25833.p2  ORF type:complete len:110 (+),score=8.85 Plantae.Rhodophyta-Purpureofilum_apyrenoidigerum.ctg25833:286-615(+)
MQVYITRKRNNMSFGKLVLRRVFSQAVLASKGSIGEAQALRGMQSAAPLRSNAMGAESLACKEIVAQGLVCCQTSLRVEGKEPPYEILGIGGYALPFGTIKLRSCTDPR